MASQQRTPVVAATTPFFTTRAEKDDASRYKSIRNEDRLHRDIHHSRPEWQKVLIDQTAGVIGAGAGIFVGSPFDLLKVRQQSNGLLANLSLWKAFTTTLQQEGPLTFFRGMLSPLVANAPLAAVVFGATGVAQRALDRHTSIDSITTKLIIASTFAGMCSTVISVPSELVKCRLQARHDELKPLISYNFSHTAHMSAVVTKQKHRGSLQEAADIVNKHGIRALYRGWVTMMWRDTPGYSIWLVTFDVLKRHFVQPGEKPSTPILLSAGAAAGLATWTATYPFDVAKSIVQTKPYSTPAHEIKMMHIFLSNYQTYGLRFFFRGYSACAVRAVPVNAVTFLCYQRILEWFSAVFFSQIYSLNSLK